MIPDNIKRHDILKAITTISKDGVPKQRRSTKFDLRFDSKKYPPKYVISLANVYVNKEEWSSKNFSGGYETNNFFIARGFEIVDKKGRALFIHPVAEDESQSFAEGKELYKRHRTLERDSRVAKIAKQLRIKETGDLMCDACNFSFSKKYKSRGAGFIEAHHTLPISQLKGKTQTQISDIALVCSNCHRMLHRTRPWLSISQLRKIIRSK